MKCSKCGADVNEGTKFCPHCGNEMSKKKVFACPKCGARVEEGTPNCEKCGQPFSWNTPAAQQQVKSVPQQQVRRRKPAYKRWWFWMLMGIATIVVVSIIIAVAANSNNNSGGGNTQQTTATTPVKSGYGLHDVVGVDDVQFTVNSVYNTKHIGSEYLGADTANNFAVVNITIKNIGSKELTVLSGMMTYHIDNNVYEVNNAGVYLENGFWVIENIGAGISKSYEVVYEIPSEYKTTDYIEVKDSTYSYKSAKIYLR